MKVGVVVCHPDDEVMWAMPILEYYNQIPNSKVFAISLTNKNTEREKDFSKVCSDLNVHHISFALRDEGWLNPLNDIKDCLNGLSREHQLELIISHPPHGNERPHPHHVEAFIECEKYCLSKNIHFGFFSEKAYTESELQSLFKLVSDAYLYLIKMYKWNFFIKIKIFTQMVWRYFLIKSQKVKFDTQSFDQNVEKMQSLLSEYKSEIEGLRQYKSYNNPNRYLVLYKYGSHIKER